MDTTQGSTFTLEQCYKVKDFAEKHADKLSAATLRYQLRNRHENGLAAALVRIGRFDYIAEPAYNIWLSSQAGKT
jgi:hypothetical protein